MHTADLAIPELKQVSTMYGIATFSVPSKFFVIIEQEELDEPEHQILPIWNGSSGEEPTGELIAQQHRQASKQRIATAKCWRLKKSRNTLATKAQNQIK